MTEPQRDVEFILGLDIGSASIGWALINRVGQRLQAAGVRVFPAGVDDLKFEKGQPGASNNADRRRYRLQRRQIRRRARRQRSLFLLLQREGLLPGADPALPPDEAARPERRNQILTALDLTLSQRYRSELRTLPAPEHVLPYFLRSRALDSPLQPEELGRVFYHLAQRRGFRSNRRAARSERQAQKQTEADDESKVKTGIRSLQEKITASGARTLGEYFSHLDPADPASKIRRCWTSRAMHQAEFAAIWNAQAPHHPSLTPALHERLQHLLYFQRPVGHGKIGPCELEPGEKRAPMASLPAQRFRLLQKVNDLRLVAPDLQEFPLDASQRAQLIAALEQQGSLKFDKLKKLLQVPKGYTFNLERGGNKTMPGNQTAAAMRKVFGPRWGTLDAADQASAVDAWLATEDDAKFSALGHAVFGLEGDALTAWNQLNLADGYARLSQLALSKLLPLMEQGLPFKTAEAAIYGTHFSGGTTYESLRPVARVFPALANPAVMRALSELRQLVNAIVREYGKPYEIRIELARDLKRNAKQRQQLSKSMRDRESERKKMVARVISDAGVPTPGRKEVEIGLLWEQAKGLCPYCGNAISFAQAFNGEFAEIDHILPRSRFPDDSFGNKVLAHTACNREKSGRTPLEAYGHGDPGRWDQILERVRKFGDPTKLRAFQATPSDLDVSQDDTFASRRLNDTRYATVLAARYLGELYGGRDVLSGDGSRRRVIHASSGLVTATLRRGWGLEAILAAQNEKGKNRLDHRHHAVDAVVIALTGNTAIQQMSRAAAADGSGQERISSRALVCPWPDFVDSVRPAIDAIQVSHRPSHRLRGALHADTVYGGRGGVSHIRKRVESLSPASAERIVDPTAARAVQQKLASLGGEPKKLEADPPTLRAASGALVPVRAVRITDRPLAGLARIGHGPSARWVSESGNHHVAVFLGRDGRSHDRWFYQIVTRLEAARRHALGLDVISRQWDGEGEMVFLFSLMGGDLVSMSMPDGKDALLVVRGISENDFSFVPHDRAAQLKQLRGTPGWVRVRRIDELRERACRKRTIDVLGRLHEAHD